MMMVEEDTPPETPIGGNDPSIADDNDDNTGNVNGLVVDTDLEDQVRALIQRATAGSGQSTVNPGNQGHSTANVGANQGPSTPSTPCWTKSRPPCVQELQRTKASELEEWKIGERTVHW